MSPARRQHAPRHFRKCSPWSLPIVPPHLFLAPRGTSVSSSPVQLASLPYKNSLDFYDEEWMYTFSRLSEDPRCAALLPTWKALESQWIAVQAQQRFLNLAIVQAQQRN